MEGLSDEISDKVKVRRGDPEAGVGVCPGPTHTTVWGYLGAITAMMWIGYDSGGVGGER